jgi:serine-type D-Ala-D-Ala carboxypeptidase (penicillin-binding protein 5/6)
VRRTGQRIAVLALVAGLVVLAGAPAASAATGQPSISAQSAIVVDAATGDVLYARGANRERPIASTTKLMTALLTLERVSLTDVFTAPPYQALPAESQIGLKTGERMAVRDLLRALLLPSANDAAATLAQGVGGSTARFVHAMNRRARQLHLRHTHYSNPVGLDEGRNYSSAADLATLARRLRANAFFRHTTDLAKAKLRTGDHVRTVVNRNTLIGRYPFVNGVKTGHTNKAGYVLVGSGTKHGVTVISAVLGDPSEGARDTDTLALLNYGLSQLRRITPVRKGQRLGTAKVRYRESETFPLVAGSTVHAVVHRGRRARVTVDAPDVIEGPKPAGARVGTATVRAGNRIVARVPVLTGAPVPGVGVADRLFGGVAGLIIVAVGLLAVGTGSVLLAMARRRRRRSSGGKRTEGVGAA